MSIQIYDWADISTTPWRSLLVGNGASISLHSGFSYPSLHSVAEVAGNLPKTGNIFTSLGTNDFEHVLLACWHAELVNTALGAPAPAITLAYQEVRDALISAVRSIHCQPASIATELTNVANFASMFNTVVTFNYDLTLYWAMMEYNQHGIHFKDAFINAGAFEPNWHFLRNRRPGDRGATMVFYGHGSLMVARDITGVEMKLGALLPSAGGQTALLNSVITAWAAGTHTPVFVSEGTAHQKLNAIRRSPYLSEVYNGVLPDLGNTVVYGLSFAANDQHIIDAIKKHPPVELAISVYGGAPPNEQQAFCHQVSGVLSKHLPNTVIKFFDSGSPGCWANS